MAQIITYPKLSTLAKDDLLLVSDVSSKNKNTNSVEVDTLAQYIITSNNFIQGGGTVNYVPIFTPTGIEIGDSQLQQSLPNSFGMYQMIFNNADRFIINKPSSVTSGDPEYLIQQDGLYKVSFGWDDDGGGFGFIYNWAGNGLRLGAAGQNPQFELNTVVPKIISHTAHEFEDAININNATTSSAGIIFNHPAGGASGVVNMYYNGAVAGSKFVISRAATGGAEIELESDGDINLNRTGNGGVLIGGLGNYADDAAAAAGGVPINGLYRNGNNIQIRIV